jgi:hypothetical protein
LVRYKTWHPEWDIWHDWDRTYFEEVFQALIEVIKQHGVGGEGWESARWEVYDKVGFPPPSSLFMLILTVCAVPERFKVENCAEECVYNALA